MSWKRAFIDEALAQGDDVTGLPADIVGRAGGSLGGEFLKTLYDNDLITADFFGGLIQPLLGGDGETQNDTAEDITDNPDFFDDFELELNEDTQQVEEDDPAEVDDYFDDELGSPGETDNVEEDDTGEDHAGFFDDELDGDDIDEDEELPEEDEPEAAGWGESELAREGEAAAEDFAEAAGFAGRFGSDDSAGHELGWEPGSGYGGDDDSGYGSPDSGYESHEYGGGRYDDNDNYGSSSEGYDSDE